MPCKRPTKALPEAGLELVKKLRVNFINIPGIFMDQLPKEIKNLIWEYLPAKDAAQFAATCSSNNLKPTFEQAYIPFTIEALAQLMFKTYRIGIYFREDYDLYHYETKKGLVYVYLNQGRDLIPDGVATVPEELIPILMLEEHPIDALIPDVFDKEGMVPALLAFVSRKNCHFHVIPYYRQILLEWIQYSRSPFRVFNSISGFLTDEGKIKLVNILKISLPQEDLNEIADYTSFDREDGVEYMTDIDIYLESLIETSSCSHDTPNKQILKITRKVLEQVTNDDFDLNKITKHLMAFFSHIYTS